MGGAERPRRRFVTGRKRARHRFIRVLIPTIERFTSLGRRPTDADGLGALRTTTQSALTTTVRIERFRRVRVLQHATRLSTFPVTLLQISI